MKRRQGFTVIEVMVSLGVMTIGAMALIGMQQQTTRANMHARELSTAMQIAQTWIERFKLDGMRWVNIGDSAVDLVQTDFLGISGGNGTSGLFTTIPITAGMTPAAGLYNPSADADLAPNFVNGLSNGFDYYGNDVSTANMGQVHFCASYRVSWVFRNDPTLWPGSPRGNDRALRVDVRVWWAKEQIGTPGKATVNSLAADFPGCVDNGLLLSPGAAGVEINNYHIVYLSTVIRPMH